jgi:hypothetical protein
MHSKHKTADADWSKAKARRGHIHDSQESGTQATAKSEDNPRHKTSYVSECLPDIFQFRFYGFLI